MTVKTTKTTTIPDRFIPAGIGALCLILTSLSAPAALSQGTPLPPSDAAEAVAEEAEKARQDESTEAPAPKPKPKPPAERAKPAAPAVFVLRDLRIPASGYLDAATFDTIRARFAGQRMTRAGAARIAEAINAEYAARDIGLAAATVQSVNARAGRVIIALNEARLGRVVTQAPGVRADYLKWRLGLPVGALADTRAINARLTRLALTDGVPVSADFTPGARPGDTDLTVVVDVPRPSGTIRLDNYGDPNVGKEQMSVAMIAPNATGRLDPFSVQALVSRGKRLGSLSYSRAVSENGARLALTLGGEQTETRSAPVVDTESLYGRLGLTYPVIVTAQQQVSAYATVELWQEQSRLAGVRFSDLRGVEGTLGVSALRNTGSGRQVLNGSLVFGSYDDRIANVSRDYSLAQIQAQVLQQLGGALLANFSAQGQFRLHGDLPSRRRMTVAGPTAVRGYPVGLGSGDAAFVLRAQIESARTIPVAANLGVLPFAFLDLGQGYRDTGAGLTAQGLMVSVGAGTSVQIGRAITGDVFVAVPLRDVTGFTGAGDVVAHASLAIRF